VCSTCHEPSCPTRNKKWEASLSWSNRGIDDHGNVGEQPYELWIFGTLPGHRKAILWYYDRNAVSALHARNERG
jgi:hypothetical protein